jgi:ribosomal protein L11 methyltransferase
LQDYYNELKITPQSNYNQFLDLVLQLFDEAIEEDNGTIILRSVEDLGVIKFGIEAFCHQSNLKCTLLLQRLANEDWVSNYKKSVTAVEVGGFHIGPTWSVFHDEKINIKIDPSLSFGSGHHETTSNCLLAIEAFVQKEHKVIDVGCGSGILSIAAMKLGACVDMCDTDDVALQDALKNCEQNEVQSNQAWVGSVQKTKACYDVVIANIVADVLAMIHKDLKKCMKKNGTLILSGILDKHEQKVEKKYNDLKQIKRIVTNEWVTLVYKNEQSNSRS